ncbi:M48 family metallopeptidase [Desulfovibrio inopinatus]|uniref:M48 family metallopeptidase n=1 Tax=Desulfovibrio inopinatus TaxID=102109 RepID=UPI0005584FA8|nr:M48 family metallopeptidase [Desulfovibrio inopinatus]
MIQTVILLCVLCALIATFVLRESARRLNLSALSSSVPEEFVGIYDADAYRRSQEYTKQATRLGSIEDGFGTVILCLCLATGVFGLLDRFVVGLNLSPLATGLVYLGVVTLVADLVLATPFSIYSTFVLEERFGFNRTTGKTFFLDKCKGYLITAILGGGLASLIILFFNAMGPAGWVPAWIGIALVTIGVMYFAPSIILPLFNTFTPLEDPELKAAIEDLAQQYAFTLEGIFVMDGSRRSSRGNAFFTGLGSRKRIALFDTLINTMTTEEIVAVLAHEIGHWKKRHIVKSIMLEMLKTGLLLFLFSCILESPVFFQAFGIATPSVAAGLIVFGIIYQPVILLLSFLSNALSRKHEFEADALSAEATRHPQALIDALKRLSVDNLSNLTPHWFYVMLNASHPPVLERIQRLRSMI